MNGEDPTCSSKREVGCLAVWSVTSNKPGNGVEYLRDNNVDTFWQSDGTQPHLVNIQFQRKVRVLEVVMYVDYRNDESYTPQKVNQGEGRQTDLLTFADGLKRFVSSSSSYHHHRT